MTKVRHHRVTALKATPIEGEIEYLKQGTDRFLMYITGAGGVRYLQGVSPHSHDTATQSLAGFMSAGDKTKLDNNVLFGTSYRGTISLPTGDLNGYLKTGAYHTFSAVSNQPSATGHYLWRLNHATVDAGGFLDILSPASITNTKLYWRKGNETTQLPYEALANESWVTTNFVSATALAGYVPTTRTVSAGAGLTGGGALSANITLALTTTGVTAGTYTSVTVDAYGRITGGSNPSSGSVAWSEITGKPTTLYDFGVLADADSRYLKLIGGTMTGNIVFTPTTGGSSTSLRTFLSYTPSNYGSGAPALNFTKLANATRYQMSIYDGSSNTGRLNFSMSELTWNDAMIATQTWVTGTALAGYATQSWVSSQGYINSTSGLVPTTRTITVGEGMTGGGNLGGNISIGLSFGTNSDNVARGNHTHTGYAPTSHTHEVSQINNLTNLLNGKVGTGTTITINGVTQDLSQNRSWTVSGGGGGNISGAGTGTNSPIAIWTGTYNISYSSLHYYTAGSPSRSILGVGGVLTGSIGDMSLYVAGGAKIHGYVSVGIPSLSKGSQYLEFEVGTTPENPRGSMPFPLMSGANFETAKARSSSLNGMFGFDTTNNVITWVQGDTIVKLGITEWGVMTKHGTSPWRYVEA